MAKKLLLADDSLTIQKVVGIVFANLDYQLLVADNGNTALDLARKERPDLVIADIGMPGLDGFELCQAIKTDAALASTPVMLLPGAFENFDESRARACGASGWLSKPFESQAMIDKVETLLAAEPLAASAPAATPAPEPETLIEETLIPENLVDELPAESNVFDTGAADVETDSFDEIAELDPLDILAPAEAGAEAVAPDLGSDFGAEEDDEPGTIDGESLEELIPFDEITEPLEDSLGIEEPEMAPTEVPDDDIWDAVSFEEEEAPGADALVVDNFETSSPAVEPAAPVASRDDAFVTGSASVFDGDFPFANEDTRNAELETEEEDILELAEDDILDVGEDEELEPFTPAELSAAPETREDSFEQEAPVAEDAVLPVSEPAFEAPVYVAPEPEFEFESEPETESTPEIIDFSAPTVATAPQERDSWQAPVSQEPAAEVFELEAEGLETEELDAEEAPKEEFSFNDLPEEETAPATASPVTPQVLEEQLRNLDPAVLEEIVSRVAAPIIEKLAAKILEQVVWDVVPDLAETMIREEIEKIKQGAN